MGFWVKVREIEVDGNPGYGPAEASRIQNKGTSVAELSLENRCSFPKNVGSRRAIKSSKSSRARSPVGSDRRISVQAETGQTPPAHEPLVRDRGGF
jgi:hypothetical protein